LNGAIDQAIEAELIEENSYELSETIDDENSPELNESVYPENDLEFNAISQVTDSKLNESEAVDHEKFTELNEVMYQENDLELNEAIDQENDPETCELVHQENNRQMGGAIAREDDCELYEAMNKDSNLEFNEALDQESSDQSNSSESLNGMETERTDNTVVIRPLKKVYVSNSCNSVDNQAKRTVKTRELNECPQVSVSMDTNESVHFASVNNKLSSIVGQYDPGINIGVSVAKKQLPAATRKQLPTADMPCSNIKQKVLVVQMLSP